jgi:hypothetical protein
MCYMFSKCLMDGAIFGLPSNLFKLRNCLVTNVPLLLDVSDVDVFHVAVL